MYKISRLQYITQDTDKYSHAFLAEQACKGGIRWIQLRVKDKPYNEIKVHALETLAVCKKYKAKLIINDNVELAKEVLADGVHLGKSDMSVDRAIEMLGNDFIIGGTANTFEDIVSLVNSGVDYIGLGPYRYTETKKNLSSILGIEGYKSIIDKCKERNISIPLISIGGIKSEDIGLLLECGVYGIAVSSVITFAENKIEKSLELKTILTESL